MQFNLTQICSHQNLFHSRYFLVPTVDTIFVPHFCSSVYRRANPHSDSNNFNSAASVCVAANVRSNVQLSRSHNDYSALELLNVLVLSSISFSYSASLVCLIIIIIIITTITTVFRKQSVTLRSDVISVTT